VVASVLVFCGCANSPGGETASVTGTGSGGGNPASSGTVGVGGSGSGGGGSGGGSGGIDCPQAPDAPFQVLWGIKFTDVLPSDIAIDASGNTYVTGDGVFVRKYSAAGELVWSVPSWGEGAAGWYHLFVGPQGKLMVTGVQCTGDDPSSCSPRRVLLEETGDPANPVKELWSDAPPFVPVHTAICPNGNIVHYIDSSVTAVTDTNAPLWTAPAPDIVDEWLVFLRCDSQNRVSLGTHCPANCMLQLDANGSQLWSLDLPFPDATWHDLRAFELGPDDSLHSAGVASGGRFWLDRVSPNGAHLWEQEFSYPDDDPMDNTWVDIGVLPSGDVWAAGTLEVPRSFLRGTSASGVFLKDTTTDFCSNEPLWITHLLADDAGGLRILGNGKLYAIKP